MNYTKTNSLSTNIINQIIDFANENDYEPFWADIISGKFNHFHYITETGKLVSFIGIMPIAENSVEITGMTLPGHRHCGHFSDLLKKALAELSEHNLNIFCEQSLDYPFMLTSLEYNDYLMKLSAGNFPKAAKAPDYELLQYIAEYEDYTELIFVLSTNNEAVGLLKIHQQEYTACIHDVIIRKRFRNSGCATKLLAGALEIFAKENSHDLLLHVKSNNVAAVKLYTNAGFEITQSLEYYRINYRP